MRKHKTSIKILIVDDDRNYKTALLSFFEKEDDIDVVATAANGLEALNLLKYTSVDVVLSDIRMPFLDGIELSRELKRDNFQGKIIALTTFNDDHTMLEMLHNGAFGFVLKSSSSEQIIAAVRAAASDGTTISPEAATALRKYIDNFEDVQLDALPYRDRQVLTLLHMGKTNEEIAQDLNIAQTTTKKSVTRLMQRFNVSNRLKLVIISRRKLGDLHQTGGNDTLV